MYVYSLSTTTLHVVNVAFFVFPSLTRCDTISKLVSLEANLAQITPLANVSYVLASSQLGFF